jgi:hypothetical protein
MPISDKPEIVGAPERRVIDSIAAILVSRLSSRDYAAR